MRGGLVANLQDGIALLDALGSRRWLVYWERAGFHAGEMAVDQLGRLLALSNPAAGSGGWLARVDGTGAAKVLAADLAGCGGAAFSPDGRLLYLTDTSLSTVDVYDYDVAAGEVSGRRRLSTVDGPGVPGAPCVDAAGCLWLPLDGGGAVRRYRPDGRAVVAAAPPFQLPASQSYD